MSKKFLVLGLVFGVILICASFSFAMMPDADNVKKVHDGADVACTDCHPAGDFKSLNPYGTAYNEAGRSVDAVKAIDAADSDGDGVSNGDEIAAGTNPGEKN